MATGGFGGSGGSGGSGGVPATGGATSTGGSTAVGGLYQGFSFASSNDTTTFPLPLPPAATLSSTLYVFVVYENSVATRPAIPGFSIVTGVDGIVAPGPTSTRILYKGQSSSPITIPNDVTMGGATAACVAFSGSVTESAVVLTGVGTSAVVDTFSKLPAQIAIAIGGYDMGPTDTLVSATLTGMSTTATYLTVDGAVTGRGGFIGVEASSNTSLSVTYPPAPATGSYVARFTVN